MYSWGPQKHLQDRRTTFLKPLFWHAKHAQNAPAKFVPDTIVKGSEGGFVRPPCLEIPPAPLCQRGVKLVAGYLGYGQQ
jgi:hypothetical protein